MLPPKVALEKLASILEQSRGYPFISKHTPALFSKTTPENKKKFTEWYLELLVLLRMEVAY